MTPQQAQDWLAEAARYFSRRPTNGEDSAFWANAANADACKKIAALLAREDQGGGSDPSSFAAGAAECVQTARDERQQRVAEWCAAAFGAEHQASVPMRGLRHAEEAIEAAQAAGVDPAQIIGLVHYIYAKEPGDLRQEIGGSGLTLLALAGAAGISADDAEAAELARVLSKPLAHFAARNQVKIDAGFDALTNAPPPNEPEAQAEAATKPEDATSATAEDQEDARLAEFQRQLDYKAMTLIAEHLRSNPAHPYSGRQCEEFVLDARDRLYLPGSGTQSEPQLSPELTALLDELEGLLEKATPGDWHHVQPFKVLPKQRTIHGPVPAQRVDYVSTWPGKGAPPGHRVVIPMEGSETTASSHDMALIAAMKTALPRLIAARRRG